MGITRRLAIGAVFAAAVLVHSGTAFAQSWQGPYLGGFIGGARTVERADERVVFDTNLDGTFSDTVRTAAGADAFSPGFCGGLAINATAAAGCTQDENGLDVGGRFGYDWQLGPFVVGGLVSLSRADVADSVTAFSTTPAFYAFTREQRAVLGFRGRAGFASTRVLAYGTFGPAWGMVKQTFTTSNGVNTFVAVNQEDAEGNERVWGYQAGGGLEFRIGGPISLFGEYLFTSLDNREASTIRSQGPAPATNPFILVNSAGTDLQRADTFDTHSIRAGINIRF